MKRPLEGVRIIEFSHVISGPYCGMLLGDMGAEMIKIENPGTGEYGRTAGAKTPSGISLWYPAYNRNKKAVTLNLKHAKAKEVLTELVKKSDVVLENFRPGLLDEMGFGYEDLKKINPAIIMASISGFGKNGPYEKKAAFDMTVAAFSGFMSINGLPDLPMKAGPAVSDFLAGLYGALGITAAIRQRDLTGEGQLVDISMLDSIMAILETAFAEQQILGHQPQRVGNRRPTSGPSNVFKTKDGFVYIAALFQNHWEHLCKIMQREDLVDVPRFATLQERAKNADELEAIMSDWTKGFTADELVDLLEKFNIPCARVKDIQAVMDDPHVKARGSIAEFDYPGVGAYPVVAPAVRFSGSEWTLSRPPLLGEDNKAVYCSLLGLSPEEYERLAQDKLF